MPYTALYASVASLHIILSMDGMVAALQPSVSYIRPSHKPWPQRPASARLGAATMLPMDRAVAPLHIGHLKSYCLDKSTQVETVACAHDPDGCHALCDEDACAVVATVSLAHRAKVGFYFGVWFLLSVGYSVSNKRVTNLLPLPWTVAAATLVVGSILVTALWGVGARPTPDLSPSEALRRFLPIAVFHAIGHTAGTVGTAAGSVSFAQVVKAAGPVYACILSATVLGQRISRRVWLSLVPIIGGVGLATFKELSFAWAALIGAVLSDVALALRNILSKRAMTEMSPANLFGTLTCLSALVSIPAALVVEGGAIREAWPVAAASAGGSAGLASQIILTGLYFYGYSEVAMKALNNIHPITHAVGNTMRRVVIMLVCMAVFRTPMAPLGALGSALAVAGSYFYSVTKHAEKLADSARERAEEEERLVEQALLAKVDGALPLEIPGSAAGTTVADEELRKDE
jgi:solute carrier family 35 protein E1